MKATVTYELSHLKGELTVPFLDPQDEDETIIEKAKAEIRKKHGKLVSDREYFKVVRREV